MFARTGYVVLAAGRDAAKLAVVIGNCDQIIPWIGDLSTFQGCERLIKDGVRQLGQLDILVNNAGIYIRGNAGETLADDWRKTLAINLDAPFYLSKAAIPYLEKTNGAIINSASDWGLQGGKRAAAYCASKGGLVLLTKAMALDYASEGIRVNAVCPGDVDTPMLENEAVSEGLTHQEALHKYGQDSPSGRVTHADEVAALVLYLSSRQAAQITGAAIPIDGGNTA